MVSLNLFIVLLGCLWLLFVFLNLLSSLWGIFGSWWLVWICVLGCLLWGVMSCGIMLLWMLFFLFLVLVFFSFFLLLLMLFVILVNL